jgi:hypothetical protein
MAHIDQLLRPSFLENPWAALERRAGLPSSLRPYASDMGPPPHVADHRLRSCRLRTGHAMPAAEPGAEAEDEPGAAHSSESDSHDDGDGASPVPVA